MALFPGEELVDITTPDGRALKLPSSVARAFGDGLGVKQSGPLPPAGGEIAPPPPVVPQSVDALPPTPAPAPPPAMEPPTTPGKLATGMSAAPAAATGGVAQRAGDIATRPGSKLTDVAPTAPPKVSSVADAQAAQTDALNDQSKAAITAADVQAAGQTIVADAYEKRNQELDKLFAARQQAAEADLAAVEKKTQEFTRLREKYANTKVDRSVDHPILAAISLALSGIGTAMKNGDKNPALEVLWQALDRKAAGQAADLEQQGKAIGLQRDEIAQLRESASNKLAMHNLLIAGAAERAARQVEEITARTSSDQIRANGQVMAAELRGRAAELTMNAAQFQAKQDQDAAQHKAQIGLGYSQLRQADRHHKDDLQFKREQAALDFEKALAAERAKKGEASMKELFELQQENEKRGVGNVNTGDPLLNQQGIELMNQADKVAAQAQQIRQAGTASGAITPADEQKASQLEQQASALRGEARVRGQFRASDPVAARELAKKYAASQSVITTIDEIKALYDENGKSYFSTDAGRAAIQSKMQQLGLGLKDAYQAGAWDKGLATVIGNITGGDPTNGWNLGNFADSFGADVGTAPEAFKAKLDSIATGLEGDMTNHLRTAKWDGKDTSRLFVRKETAGKGPVADAARGLAEGVSPMERAANVRNESGVEKAVTRGVFRADASNEDRAREAEQSGSLTRQSLSKSQATHMDALERSLKAGGKGGEKALGQLTAFAKSDRPDIAVAALEVLKTNNPQAFEKVRGQVTPEVAQRLGAADAVQRMPQPRSIVEMGARAANPIIVGNTPNPRLAQEAVVDDRAYGELSRRAADGDPEARQLLDNVIRTRSGGTRSQREIRGKI